VIRIFVTGGTFDKNYDEISGTLSFKETHLPEMLRLGRSRVDVSVQSLMMIDSLDMTDADRELVVRNCQQCPETCIVITHGTDTMVETAAAVAKAVKLPPSYTLEWSGQYEYMQRATERLQIVIPITLGLVIVLLYLNTRRASKVGIVLLAVPFSLVGAFWLLWLLGYNLSVAVWVGIIALAGVDAETGVVMLLYLDQSYDRFKQQGRLRNPQDLQEAIEDGAVKRIRTKMMTVMAILMGLLPIMWSHGAGADVMKRIATPMVGGVVTSFVLELLIYPVIFAVWKEWREVRPAMRHTVPVSPSTSASALTAR